LSNVSFSRIKSEEREYPANVKRDNTPQTSIAGFLARFLIAAAINIFESNYSAQATLKMYTS
jgi:hypothetical protein